MKTSRPLFSLTAAALLAATALPAGAQISISIDRVSPSIGCGGPPPVAARHIYSEVAPPTGGCDVAGPGPQLQVNGLNLGLVPGDDVDALSANLQWSPDDDFIYVFSADRASQGQPVTPYRNQFIRNQSAGDLFTTAALPSTTPGAVMAALCGAPALIAPPAPLFRNQHQFNLVPTALAGVFVGPGAVDNLDAVELDDLDTNNDGIQNSDVYFSLDPASPSVGSAADIYYSPFGGGAFVLFAGPATMGLTVPNNIDALVVWDRQVPGAVDPTFDYVLFSLAPGSPALNGPDGVAGTADDFSAADVFVSDFTGVFCLYTTANQLGLRFQDNLDGLDVSIW